MPGPIQETLVQPNLPAIEVSLDPVRSALQSLLLLAKVDELSGLDAWVVQTAAALSEDERREHNLVMIGFYHAIMPEQSWNSFPAFLDYLTACNPLEMRDQMFRVYEHICVPADCEGGSDRKQPAPADWGQILSGVDSYLAFLRERFGEDQVDDEMESRAYTYVMDPPAMRDLIVSHLRKMWHDYLGREWERVLPMLRDAVTAWQQVDFDPMSRFEAAQMVTGQDLECEKWEKWLDEAERVVFVPTPHIGPYLVKYRSGTTFVVLFGARLPAGVSFYAPDLNRAEIVVRLNALADDSRLGILKLVADAGELRSQDVMDRLSLSQSAASRHLKQLSATGFLRERRCQGAKCYQFDTEKLDDTLGAIRSFLTGASRRGE